MTSGLPRCTEQTVVVTIPLAEGRNWAWLGDCNVLALSDRLDEQARQAALIEVGIAWRRSFLRVVGGLPGGRAILEDMQEPAAS